MPRILAGVVAARVAKGATAGCLVGVGVAAACLAGAGVGGAVGVGVVARGFTFAVGDGAGTAGVGKAAGGRDVGGAVGTDVGGGDAGAAIAGVAPARSTVASRTAAEIQARIVIDGESWQWPSCQPQPSAATG